MDYETRTTVMLDERRTVARDAAVSFALTSEGALVITVVRGSSGGNVVSADIMFTVGQTDVLRGIAASGQQMRALAAMLG